MRVRFRSGKRRHAGVAKGRKCDPAATSARSDCRRDGAKHTCTLCRGSGRMTMLAPTVPDAETRSERRDAALWVRMNRPGDDNRITPVMVHEINDALDRAERSEEHTSALQSLMSISYAVFCLKKNK